MVGASAWAAGRRARALPVAGALAAAGVAGFLFAQWAQRPKVEVASAPAAPAAAPASSALPAARVAPQTVPPATYAAPYVPAAARSVAPVAPPRTSAPAEAEPPAGPLVRAVAAPRAVTVEPVEPTFTLQAVTEQDGHPVAIVNGQLVRVGDVVEGARVLRIDAEAVELEKDGRRIVVSF